MPVCPTSMKDAGWRRRLGDDGRDDEEEGAHFVQQKNAECYHKNDECLVLREIVGCCPITHF